ncbi:MAG: methyl-accepting chemotaxis protein [Spirochaetaceae bacterium]|nr:methyl-accepting chemotaxis protein [Spirochaetaceae bacterium]
MKLSGRISLLIGVLVLFISVSIGSILIVVLTGSETKSAKDSLLHIAGLGSEILSAHVQNQLAIFQEVANRARTRTMVWETQAESLTGDIDRLGYLDIAVVNTAGEAHYIKDGSTADLHDRAYITRALAGSRAISDVLISRVINGPVVMYAAPITNGDHAGARTIGALIGRKDGTNLSAICEQVTLGNTGYSFMVNQQGVFIAHPDGNFVFEQFNPITEAASNPQYRPLADAVSAALQNGQGTVEYTLNGKRMVAAHTTVGDFGWTLFVTIEYAELMAGTYRARSLIILLVVGFLAAGILAALALARSITKPIKEIDRAAHSLAALDFDITLKKNRRDELGDLQASLLIIRDNMQKKVTDMNNEMLDKQLNIANNLKEAILNSSQGLGVIINNMDAVKQKTGAQVSSVDQTSTTVGEIVQNINTLDGAVATQVLNISRSSESIEQMVQDTESVRAIVQNANQTTRKLGDSSEAGRKMLAQLTAELDRIAAQSVFLEEANKTLVNIAAQTNILAMNAAIEAAHAGETGKGFAVVAGEIRKLAADSDKESASISAEIKKMRVGIAAIQEASGQTVGAMTGMFTEITDMGASFETINRAVEAQTANGSRILSALATLKETTDLVKNGSSDIQQRSGLIQETVERLKSISNEVNDSVQNVEEATKGIESSLEVARKIAEGRYLMLPS